ncbi:MAG: hypothetical protein IKZ88_09295, partial [Neisseriaceae bacterium]|nr:hypothetical protein [Neisseriaceae bacterium]
AVGKAHSTATPLVLDFVIKFIKDNSKQKSPKIIGNRDFLLDFDYSIYNKTLRFCGGQECPPYNPFLLHAQPNQ